MGPIQNTKNTNQHTAVPTQRKGAITRSQNSTKMNKFGGKDCLQPKRKADVSPPKDKTLKRSAFGDITNALGKTAISQDIKNLTKKVTAAKSVLKSKTVVVSGANCPKALPDGHSNIVQGHVISKTQKPKNVSHVTKPIVVVEKNIEVCKETTTLVVSATVVEISTLPEKDIEKSLHTTLESQKNDTSSKDSSSSDGSLYVSALDDSPNDGSSHELQVITVTSSPLPSELIKKSPSKVPAGVVDFDNETVNDPFQVSLYAMDIFNYLKEREAVYVIVDYMDKQPFVSQWMRSLLVDWMVGVQESFELNHETLYLAVKLVDLYLSKVTVSKETLQLVGAASMFIASKFDERIPPLVEDFLYICDGAYTDSELIKMECNVLRVVDFNLGIPLSYRFLRRYARCAKLSLPILTLARYILELSLMEYVFVFTSSSKLAAAALLLALKMKLMDGWTPTLEYYSGYKLEDIKTIVHQLNVMLHKKPKTALATVRNKYSHKIFFEVAKTPLLDKLDL